MPGAKNVAWYEKLKLLAELQQGYFLASQAREIGYSNPNMTYHVKSGNWRRIEHGLYRLPWYADTPASDLYYACLWARSKHDEPLGTISHESALYHYGMRNVPPAEIQLTVPSNFRKQPTRPMQLHKRDLADADIAATGWLRVVTREKALADVPAAPRSAEAVEAAHEPAVLWLTPAVISAPAGDSPPAAEKIWPEIPLAAKIEASPVGSGRSEPPGSPPYLRPRSSIMAVERDRLPGLRRRREAGFTLVELLVVLAIISVLFTLLMPALEKALSEARRLACANNLRQIFLCSQEYLDEYQQWLPYGPNEWKTRLDKYVDLRKGPYSIFYCPEAIAIPKASWSTNNCAYTANYSGYSRTPAYSWNLGFWKDGELPDKRWLHDGRPVPAWGYRAGDYNCSAESRHAGLYNGLFWNGTVKPDIQF